MKTMDLIMGYKSPIELIYQDVFSQFEQDINSYIISEIKTRLSINIDEQELLKALKYDRDQYDAGFMNGYSTREKELIRCKDCKFYNPDANVGYLAYCDLAGEYEHLDPEWYCCHAERRETDEKR